jgi:hypothetical protein
LADPANRRTLNAVATKDKSLFGGTRTTGDLRREPDITPDLDALERDMNELRAVYELYFMGVEKNEPTQSRDAVRARLRQLGEKKPRNTAAKFRLQQLKAKFISFENHFNRVNRAREAGTYRRDVIRAERRAAQLEAQRLREEQPLTGPPTEIRGVAPREGEELTEGLLHGDSDTGGQRVPPPRPGGRADWSRPRASRAEDLSDRQLQRLYQTYVGARRRCGESVDVRYEDMASTLRKQVPQLMNRTGAKSVEFKVVIRGGKAVLKALPRHED